MFAEYGYEFWRVEDQAIRDEFAAIFRPEVEDYEPTREDLAEMAEAFEAMDREIFEREILEHEEPDFDL